MIIPQTPQNTARDASYASAAAESAAEAKASETAAAASATTATTQAGIATTQAGIATTQAGIATTQATNAGNSATAAAGSAATATTQAGIATTQAGIATTQAGNAAASAAAASDSAGVAEIHADDAQAYRDEAEAFRNQAEGHRDAAEAFKNDAATSETNAAASAADAAASAALLSQFAGEPGGVAFSSGSYTNATKTFNGDFELIARVLPGARSGTLWSIVFSDGTYNVALSSFSSSANCVGVRYTASTGVLQAVADGTAGSTLTTRTAWATATLSGVGSSLNATVKWVRDFNFKLDGTGEYTAAMKGESVGRMAWRGYSQASYSLRTPHDGSIAGNVITLGGEGLSSPMLIADSPLKRGQVVRVRFTNSAPVYTNFLSYTGTTAISTDHISTLVPVGTYEFEYNINNVDEVLVGNGFIFWGDDIGASAGNTVTIHEVTILGTVADHRPENVLGGADWMDASRNCYDLHSVGGATALNPRESYSRTIAVTVSGATITAGAAPASIGTLTGATGTDAAALAAVRQWDAVSASWAQSRPTNAGGVIATATANGTVTLETFALGSNATVAASTAVKIVHTQR